MTLLDEIIQLNNEAASSMIVDGRLSQEPAIRNKLKTALRLTRTALDVLVNDENEESADNTTSLNNNNVVVVRFQFLLQPSGSSSSSSCSSSFFVNNQEGGSSSSSSSSQHLNNTFFSASPIVLTTTIMKNQEGGNQQGNLSSSLQMISSILLYNLALTYHHMAVMKRHNNDNESSGRKVAAKGNSASSFNKLFQLALNLYSKAYKLLSLVVETSSSSSSLDDNDSIMPSLFLMAIMSNQGHIYDAIGNYIESEMIYNHLLQMIISTFPTTTQTELLERFLCNTKRFLETNKRFAPAA